LHLSDLTHAFTLFAESAKKGDAEKRGRFNLGEKLVGIFGGSMDMSVLDRYTRQRKHVAVNHVKTITERNKKLINERDPELRKRNHDMLHENATDPKLAREYILRTSLMKSLDEVAAIQ
jgi:3-(3-hydroxy-phenyl)propionate hydroxylase